MKVRRYINGILAKLAVVGEVFVAVSRSSQKVEIGTRCILYSASDANRGYQGPDGFFSPILEPIQEYYKTKSYKTINLSYPLSYYHSNEVRGGAVLLNRQAIVILLIEFVEKWFLGKSLALQKKSNRRYLLLRNILSSIRPKLICAFQATPELCKAAHELNIAVVEPMHGMNLSPDDKIFQNSVIGIDIKALPDAYLAYDDRTYATLCEFLGGRKNAVFRMPHPWHVECQNTKSHIINVMRSSVVFSTAMATKIVVTLQWGYAGERDSLSNIIPNGIMHPSIEQAIVENPNVLWLLRMHPVQLRARGYKAHRNYVKALSKTHSNVEWQDATTLPLPTILANVQGHITMSSGTTGEAAIFGVPSLLLCPTLKPGEVHDGWFSELAEDGLVEFGELKSECINNWISRLSTVQNNSHRIDWKEERKIFSMVLDKVLETYEICDGHGRRGTQTERCKARI